MQAEVVTVDGIIGFRTLPYPDFERIEDIVYFSIQPHFQIGTFPIYLLIHRFRMGYEQGQCPVIITQGHINLQPLLSLHARCNEVEYLVFAFLEDPFEFGHLYITKHTDFIGIAFVDNLPYVG